MFREISIERLEPRTLMSKTEALPARFAVIGDYGFATPAASRGLADRQTRDDALSELLA